MSDVRDTQPSRQKDYPQAGGPSPAYQGDVIETELIVTDTDDASITGIIPPFSARGRFAASFNHNAISGNTKVFASITEVDAANNPFLGLADTKIYNIVPTFNRVTIRGENIWDGPVRVRISLVIF